MLHIHNGDSAVATAKKSGLPGEHLAWREALVCGAAPGGLSTEEFRRVRAKHLAESYGLNREPYEAELRAQEEALGRFYDHEEVILWFEHDLFCQAHLIYLLNWFSQRELGKTRLSLISIGEFSGIEDFRGFGQLSAEQLISLFPQRHEVTSAQLNLGSKAWRAYSSSDPREIESLLGSDTSALPFLKSALFKHLERFPSASNGLGRVENLALELIAAGHREFKRLFPALGKREPSYGFGDAQIFLELKRLDTASHPLITMRPKKASPMDSVQLLKTAFQITDRGKAVLNGDQDSVLLNGIDLWLGGVHLQGDEAAWRWDAENKKLTQAR